MPTDANGLAFGRPPGQVLNIVYLTPRDRQFGRVLPPRRQRPASHQQLTRAALHVGRAGGPGASARPFRPPAPARVAAMTLTMTREKDISLHMKDENV